MVENIRANKMVAGNIRDQAIRFNTRSTKADPEPVSERTPLFRDIRINGLTGDTKTA